MVGQSLISSALFMLTRISKTLSFSMMAIRKHGNILCLSSSFSSIRVSSLQASCINGNRLLSCMSLKNMSKKMELSIYVGADAIKWNFKNKWFRLLNTKARITSSGFWEHLLRISKIRDILLPLILALSVFTCNHQYGKML